VCAVSGPVVAGFDGSAPAHVAVRFAANEAVLRGCDLFLYHAFSWPLIYPPLLAASEPQPHGPRVAMLTLLTQTARDVERDHPGLSVHTRIIDGSPGGVLVTASQEAGLLVVGHRGLGGFTGLLAGSVGMQAAGHAGCPVMVVRGEGGPAGAPIVLGVDGSAGARAAADAAFAQAHRRHVELLVVHHQAPSISRAEAEVVAAGHGLHAPTVDEFAESVQGIAERYGDVQWQGTVVHGDSAATALMAAADAAGAGLLVVGSRGVGGFRAMVMGSTSRTLVEHAPCPVMVIPPTVHPA
jgi:nucleotide-binding universal stress UspA family protein